MHLCDRKIINLVHKLLHQFCNIIILYCLRYLMQIVKRVLFFFLLFSWTWKDEWIWNDNIRRRNQYVSLLQTYFHFTLRQMHLYYTFDKIQFTLTLAKGISMLNNFSDLHNSQGKWKSISFPSLCVFVQDLIWRNNNNNTKNYSNKIMEFTWILRVRSKARVLIFFFLR